MPKSVSPGLRQTPLTITLAADDLTKIEALAKTEGISRSLYVRTVVEGHLKQVRRYEAVLTNIESPLSLTRNAEVR